MHSLSLLLAAGLTTIASAAPAWTECPSGSSYYVCAKNGFSGCINYDPCNMDTAPAAIPAGGPAVTSTTKPAPSSVSKLPVSSSPTATIPSNTPRPKTPGKCESFNPTLYYVFPDQPSVSLPNSTYFWLSSDNGSKNKRDIVALWDLPEDAKNCGLSWVVPPRENNFAFAVSATIRAYDIDLKGKKTIFDTIGTKDVSFEKVKDLVAEKSAMGSDTTNWPQLTETGASGGSGSTAKCGGQVALYFSLDQQGQQGATIIGQKEGHGYYLTYDC